MSTTMRFLLAVVLISALCSLAVSSPVVDETSRFFGPAVGFVAKRSFSGYMPWQKKWGRLEPSIRFFKRSGLQPLLYDDAFF